MNAKSLWQATSKTGAKRGPVKRNQTFDAVVIGGGITGLTSAYHLKQAGFKVCLLERDRLGSGDTGFTTAHLTYVADLRISQLASTFGDAAAKLVCEAGDLAIDTIEATIQAEKIDCDFRRVPGFLCAPFGSKKGGDASLKKDAKKAVEIGFPAQFVAKVPYFDCSGVRFPNQAKFHPLKYHAGLARAVNGGGSRIFEQSEVSKVHDDPLSVIANGKKITADFLVNATHVPLTGTSGLFSAMLFQSKIFPYTSYAIGAKMPKGLIAEACYWDTSDPYYYLRIESGKAGDYAIFGGEDHKTGQEISAAERFEKLEQRLLALIPDAKPDRRWSGQVIETVDGLPYIGETARQFMATGFSGNGMTFGTLAGLMARDAALKRKNPWQSLLSLDRKKIRGGAWNYVTENIDYPYYYLKDRIVGSEGASSRAVQRGEGKILSLAGEKVACSRDEHGKLHKISPYCTHMGCIVHWNDAEKTWDCPCHGSRFHPGGDVLAGPAEDSLKPIPSGGRKKRKSLKKVQGK